MVFITIIANSAHGISSALQFLMPPFLSLKQWTHSNCTKVWSIFGILTPLLLVSPLSHCFVYHLHEIIFPRYFSYKTFTFSHKKYPKGYNLLYAADFLFELPVNWVLYKKNFEKDYFWTFLRQSSSIFCRNLRICDLRIDLQIAKYILCRSGQFRGQKSLGPLEISLEMAHYVVFPQKK